MKTYRTSQVAKLIGIHANTVRLYESCGLIPKPRRLQNGYRVFTDLHLEQFRLARAALQVEVLQNGLRKQAIEIIRASAREDYPDARRRTQSYIQQVDLEACQAEEAIHIARRMLDSPAEDMAAEQVSLNRMETAKALRITVDTLRNWELNGLVSVGRKANGFRRYTEDDLKRLKIIRSLRCANYSLSAILRMLHALSRNPESDLREVIDTPRQDDDIITACDRLLTSLSEAKANALFVAGQIEKMELMAKQAEQETP